MRIEDTKKILVNTIRTIENCEKTLEILWVALNEAKDDCAPGVYRATEFLGQALYDLDEWVDLSD